LPFRQPSVAPFHVAVGTPGLIYTGIQRLIDSTLICAGAHCCYILTSL
jgi:hypothetical protein